MPDSSTLTPDEIEELRTLATPRLIDLLGRAIPEIAPALQHLVPNTEEVPDPFDDPGQGVAEQAARPPMPMPQRATSGLAYQQMPGMFR